jgi:predicted PurR-regulated permease PerM
MRQLGRRRGQPDLAAAAGLPATAERAKEAGPPIWGDGLGRAAIRSLQVLLVLTLVVVVTYVAIQLRLVVVPLLITTLIAAAVSPVVDWLDRHRVPRALATLLTMLAGGAALGGIVWWISGAVGDQWSELRESASEGLSELRAYLVDGPLPISEENVVNAQDRLREFAEGSQFQQGAISGATLVLEVVTGIFLGVVLLYFLLKDGRKIWRFISGQLPASHRDRWDLVATRSSAVLGGYVRGTAVVAFVDAVVIGVALAILGVPLALPLAVVVFLGAFVPLVGATVAGALAALVALVASGPITALIVVGVVIAVNQLEGDILAPVVLGQALALHPLAILLALTAGTIVAGIVGALLSVPFAAVAWTAVKTFREPAPQ